MKAILIGLALIITAAPASAQTKKIPVFVDATTSTTLGNTLAYTLREQLRSSQTYEVVLKRVDAVFVISLVSIDITADLSVASSIALAIENDNGYDYLMDHWITTTGSERVGKSVTDIIASIDKDVQALVKKVIK
jgi:hypothetical protein